jgi:hypothetical protein
MTKSKEPFVMLPLSLLDSPTWHSLSINARRFIDFLMIEHMKHGGKANGALLAPWNQLKQFGIAHRHVANAIEEAISLGFVDRRRGFGRSPNAYALTFLPPSGGGDPCNRWRSVAGSEGNLLHAGSEGNPPQVPKGTHKARSTSPKEPAKPQNEGFRREPPYKKASYQGEAKAGRRARLNGAKP